MVYAWKQLSLKSTFFVFWKFYPFFFVDFSTIDDQGRTAVGGYHYIVKNFSILFFPATVNLSMGSIVLGFESFQARYKVRF